MRNTAFIQNHAPFSIVNIVNKRRKPVVRGAIWLRWLPPKCVSVGYPENSTSVCLSLPAHRSQVVCIPGVNAQVDLYPDRDCVVAVLANRDPPAATHVA